MVATRSLVYLVADIIGSSLIMQEGKYREFDLFAAFRCILVPEIKKHGGTGIEFTGDDVSARFPDSCSAIRAGFAIQHALSVSNSKSDGPHLAARIGICGGEVEGRSQTEHLSLSYASCLQELGRADVLCVSSSVIDEIKSPPHFYVHALGWRELDLIPSNDSVFYLFKDKPGVFQRWSLQIKQLKLQATHFAKAYCSLSALVAVMLLSAFLHISSDKKNQIHVYLLPVIDFSTQQHGKEISRFSALIRKSLSAVPVITVTSGSNTAHIDTQLVCSFQQIADRLRLTWGIYRASDMVQTAGGIVTGKIADIAGLEDTLLQRVIGRLESDQNALSYLRD